MLLLITMVGLLSHEINVVNFFLLIWLVYVYEVCYGHVRYMFDACTAFVWNVYQLCCFKVKEEEEENVNLGCLKHWVVCAQWYMYLFASEKYTMFISLDGKRNHNVNVCSQNESQFCCNHYNRHPGLKRLYSSAKTKPVYYTNTRDFSRISN